MKFEQASALAYRFTADEKYDDVTPTRLWATYPASVIDADGVRRVYATDFRMAVRITCADGDESKDAIPEGFPIDKVRGYFGNWDWPLAESFTLYYANLESATRAAWRDYAADIMLLQNPQIDAYDYPSIRIALPDRARTCISVYYAYSLLTAFPEWTHARGAVRNNTLCLDMGPDIRAVVKPLFGTDYCNKGVSMADAVTGALVHKQTDAGMDWPPTKGGEQ